MHNLFGIPLRTQYKSQTGGRMIFKQHEAMVLEPFVYKFVNNLFGTDKALSTIEYRVNNDKNNPAIQDGGALYGIILLLECVLKKGEINRLPVDIKANIFLVQIIERISIIIHSKQGNGSGPDQNLMLQLLLLLGI